MLIWASSGRLRAAAEEQIDIVVQKIGVAAGTVLQDKADVPGGSGAGDRRRRKSESDSLRQLGQCAIHPRLDFLVKLTFFPSALPMERA